MVQDKFIQDDDKDMKDRLERASETETNIFGGMRNSDGSPVLPVKLGQSDMFNFRCQKGVSCWNKCCHGADITLTPYDIFTMAKHLGKRPAEFTAEYTVPDMHHGANLPISKLAMTGKKGDGACVFMDDEKGCTIYEARPATCRYYPLGLGVMKMKGMKEKEDMYFLVKEDHCEGHEEDDSVQTVSDYRSGQGVEPYDLLNERWIDILMKMSSWRSVGGPGGKDVSKETKKMFYMIGTDPDTFRRFVLKSKFLEIYDIDDDMLESVKKNDDVLLQLGFDWLRAVMFNEKTLTMKDEVIQGAIADARSGKFTGVEDEK